MSEMRGRGFRGQKDAVPDALYRLSDNLFGPVRLGGSDQTSAQRYRFAERFDSAPVAKGAKSDLGQFDVGVPKTLAVHDTRSGLTRHQTSSLLSSGVMSSRSTQPFAATRAQAPGLPGLAGRRESLLGDGDCP